MNKKEAFRILAICTLFILAGLSRHPVSAQFPPALEQRIKKIMSRPEFAHSRFGIEFYSLDTGKVLYELNSQQLFVPGSTTKLLTEGTALELLGGDYRFHTRVYRTGPIKNDGTLDGDLVLVASGDSNLSNRIQPDGTLAFEDQDHSYGGPDSKGLAGDPLQVIRELARQVAAKGIKKIKGRVLVDATLFPEGERELGTVVVSPGASENAAAQIKIAAQTAYVTIINQATTGKADSKSSIKYENEKLNS